jgi:hypothetical protein
LKQDRLGRVRTSAERRAELLAEYGRTSMSAGEFADYVGVKYTTFATWLTKAKKKGKDEPGFAAEATATDREVPVHWMEACVEGVEIQAAKSGPPLVVQLPGGARLEIGDSVQAALAAELIRALEPTPGRPGRC